MNKNIKETLFHRKIVSKTRAGGRQRSFSAICIAGDENGKIGTSLKKSSVSMKSAIEKANIKAKKNMQTLHIHKGGIAHNLKIKQGAVKMLFFKRSQGLKVPPRLEKVCNLAGIKNMGCKIISRSSCPHGILNTFIKGLTSLENIKDISNRLNKPIHELLKRQKSYLLKNFQKKSENNNV